MDTTGEEMVEMDEYGDQLPSMGGYDNEPYWGLEEEEEDLIDCDVEQEKAAVKFQCILRGKRGREELAFRKERERRVKALCRRCLGDTGRLGFLAFREYLAVAREEKGKAATKLQTRFRMRRAKARLEWERKEKIRKEELIAMALGRNTER